MKVAAVEKLLQPPSSSSKPKGALIQDLDGSPIKSLDAPAEVVKQPAQANDDEPSMLELMMAAQKEAAAEVKQKKSIEAKAKESGFGSGLKKGFFSSAKPTTSKPTGDKSASISAEVNKATTKKTEKTDFDDDIIDLTNVSGKKSSPGNKKDSEKFVFDDVQKALDEDHHPLLQQIKKNGRFYLLIYAVLICFSEWVTPDLMTIMQTNKIIAKGMKDPKCVSAMQLMQSDPKQAMARFKDDEDVSLFLREFGSVMAAHFEGLAATQGQQQTQTQPQQAGISEVNSGGKIEEIGVLQAQALQRQKVAAESSKKAATTSTASGGSVVKSTTSTTAPKISQETEEEKVQRVSSLEAFLCVVG